MVEVKICVGPDCSANCSEDTVKKVEEMYGVTANGGLQPNMPVCLTTMQCIGLCSLGPNTFVDGKYQGGMTPEKMEAHLKSLNKNNKMKPDANAIARKKRATQKGYELESVTDLLNI